MTRVVASASLAVVLLAGCAQSAPTASPAPATPTAVALPSAASIAPSPTTERTAPSSAPLPEGSEAYDLDPAQFAGIDIDNLFWPMAPGSRWVYSETDEDGNVARDEVTVLDTTKVIAGIQAREVHDILTLDGETVEDTIDWYAQDAAGNLWYLGEDTKEYENGKVASTAGSWQAGVDGALAGIIVPAQPAVGMTYRQEFYRGEAEDSADVLSLTEHATVPAGTYEGCLQTRDYTPLEPDVEEQKWYASGVGPVQTIQTKGGTSTEQLVEYTPGPS